ncbi:SDR family NAD(P)-dependent oxidoreductase [Thermodesulfobacteriota bacterium]
MNITNQWVDRQTMILDEFRLEGDVALLTCYGQDRLSGLVSALVEAGAKVAVAGPDHEDIDLAVERARNMGGAAFAIPTDLTDGKDVQVMTEQVLSKYGRLDILVNNLNLEFAKPLIKMTHMEWKRIIDANLTSLFSCIKAAGEHMLEKNSGRIVNITSGLAQRGLEHGSAYCASMGGALQLTRALALEWAIKNVRVNAVGIGWMKGAFSEDQEDDPMAKYIPMRRRGGPEDIIPMVLFLASNASSYMSGYIYFADGGLMARA